MKPQNIEELPQSSCQRLSEIGQILFQGIIRLKEREISKISSNQLDSKLYRSVHGMNNNRRISAL